MEQKYEQQLFITQENLVGRFYHPFNYLFQVFYLKVTFQCSTLPQGVNNQQIYWFLSITTSFPLELVEYLINFSIEILSVQHVLEEWRISPIRIANFMILFHGFSPIFAVYI